MFQIHLSTFLENYFHKRLGHMARLLIEKYVYLIYEFTIEAMFDRD